MSYRIKINKFKNNSIWYIDISERDIKDKGKGKIYKEKEITCDTEW